MKKNIEELIEEALSIETFTLGADFKDRVCKVIRKKERSAQRKLYLLISLGVLVLFAAGIGLIQYFGDLQSLSKFDQIIPFAVMIGGLVALIQYLDKRLVKDRFFKQLA